MILNHWHLSRGNFESKQITIEIATERKWDSVKKAIIRKRWQSGSNPEGMEKEVRKEGRDFIALSSLHPREDLLLLREEVPRMAPSQQTLAAIIVGLVVAGLGFCE